MDTVKLDKSRFEIVVQKGRRKWTKKIPPHRGAGYERGWGKAVKNTDNKKI